MINVTRTTAECIYQTEFSYSYVGEQQQAPVRKKMINWSIEQQNNPESFLAKQALHTDT